MYGHEWQSRGADMGFEGVRLRGSRVDERHQARERERMRMRIRAKNLVAAG